MCVFCGTQSVLGEIVNKKIRTNYNAGVGDDDDDDDGVFFPLCACTTNWGCMDSITRDIARVRGFFFAWLFEFGVHFLVSNNDFIKWILYVPSYHKNFFLSSLANLRAVFSCWSESRASRWVFGSRRNSQTALEVYRESLTYKKGDIRERDETNNYNNDYVLMIICWFYACITSGCHT